MHNKVAARQIKNQILYGALLEKQANAMKGFNAVIGTGLGVNLGILGGLGVEKLQPVADAIARKKAMKSILSTAQDTAGQVNKLAQGAGLGELVSPDQVAKMVASATQKANLGFGGLSDELLAYSPALGLLGIGGGTGYGIYKGLNRLDRRIGLQ